MTNMSPNSSLEMPTSNTSTTTEYIYNNANEDCLAREPSTSAEVVCKTLAYFVILLVSLVGNLLVLFITYKNKQLRKSINYFVFNMAVSDLFNPLTIMPIQIVAIITRSTSWAVDKPWILGNILCKLSYFLPDVSLIVSIESLVLITMDRFVSAVFPLNTKLESTKARLIGILCTWMIAIAVHAPYFYTFRLTINPYDNKTYCILFWGPAFDHVETHKRYVMATFITFVLVPICFFVIVYWSIARVLKAKNKQTKQQLSYHQRHREEQLRKIVRMSVAIIISFVVCMIPQLCFMFTRIFLWNWGKPPICVFRTVVPFIAIFMMHSWSAVNPCICLISNKIYRNSFRKILL
ncbi:neuropeptide FF receptor 2-like [Oculina patagonica]